MGRRLALYISNRWAMSIDKIVLEDNSKVKLMNDEYPKHLADMSPSILSDMKLLKLWHGQLPRSPDCGVWGVPAH